MSLKSLSDYTIYSKYAHYVPELKRRETWDEIIERVFGMHEKKYQKELEENEEFKKEFLFAKGMIQKKKVLGSQRALQYGGEHILNKNERIFNCSAIIIDKIKSFQDTGFLLLAGCGVGISVQTHHIDKLPKIQKRNLGKKIYQIPDSIEGWADAVGILVSSFCESNSVYKEYEGYEIEFDFSLIRKKGALIAKQFLAPGPIPLKNGLKKIEKLLTDRVEISNTLRPIDAFDVIMHMADFTVAGGLRRSAVITLFSKTDEEMISAKTGDWYITNPQRARSNNSVVLRRDTTTKEEFFHIYENVKQYGEPGFYWVSDDYASLTNPCMPSWAPISSENGIKKLGDIKIGDKIWSESGWTKVVNKWSTGVKKVYRYGTTAGVFYGTENHQLVSNGVKIEAKDCEVVDILRGEFNNNITLDNQDILDGVVFGDGYIHKASNNLILLCIGGKDSDYHTSEISKFIGRERPGVGPFAWEVKTTISASELPKTYDRVIPDRFFYGDKSKVIGFLRGLFTANGSMAGGRVTLKASSFKVIEQVQIMLSSIGIKSYYTTNKASTIKFSNGEYLCKQSYDLNISIDREKFYSTIGFIQNYKTEELEKFLDKKSQKPEKVSYDIISCDLISEEEVFDITVDNNSHTFWTGGVNVSNCCEIGFWPVLPSGETGVSFCNLVEINGKDCTSKEVFYDLCRAATIIGTLQAGYNSFPYLGKVTEELAKKEALVGVSLTGWMENPQILFNEETLKTGARICKEVNEKIAKFIDINPAARLTCCKPSGSSSCILQTSSGIHPHHSKRYIRNIQVNKQEFAGQHYKKINPTAVVESVWSSNKSDDVISFLCEVPKGSILKNDLSAVEFLEKIKLVQNSWVLEGTVRERGLNPTVTNNVSNTCVVRNEKEWKDVAEFIYENREFFSGISLLSSSGDLDYRQAPFTTVLTDKEIVEKYGNGSLMASGLIVDGITAFDGDLFSACEAILGTTELPKLNKIDNEPQKPSRRKFKTEKDYSSALINYSIELNLFFQAKGDYTSLSLKYDWVRRAKQFSERYFNNDIKLMTYCLKHVDIWKKYLDIKRDHKEIDWSTVVEEKIELIAADSLASAACSGGKCEI